MANLIGEWKFDELSSAFEGQSVKDTWGDNDCVLSTGSDGLDKLKSGSDCVYGKCLYFEGSTDYLSCGSNVSIGLNSFTWSFWGKTAVNSVGQTVIYRLASTTGWIGRFSMPYTSTTNVLFYVTQSSYVNGSIFRYANPQANSSNTTDNKWHFLVATCDRSQHKAPDVYLDGVLNNGGAAGYCDQLTDDIPAGIFYIGYGGFTGFVDEVRVYSAAIPVSQIREQYYAGMNRLLANGDLTKDDYEYSVVKID